MSKKRREHAYFKPLAALMLALCILCTGCMNSVIAEDEHRGDLPALDPEAGMAKEISCAIYTRVLSENYITGVQRSFEVRTGERTEHAIMETLLKEPAAISGAANTLFPEGTKIKDVTLDGTILYVTLSKEFLDQKALDKEQSELKKDWEKGRYSKDEYEAMRQRVLETHYARRRLAVYAIVNTLTGYNDKMRVLLLIESDNAGAGARLARSEFGLTADTGRNADLIEPMRFIEEAVITPQIMAVLLLEHLQNEEYEQVYALVTTENLKPDYARIEDELRALGILEHFSVNGATGGDGRITYVNLDLSFRGADAEETLITNQRLLMRGKDGLFRPDYSSLMKIFGGAVK